MNRTIKALAVTFFILLAWQINVKAVSFKIIIPTIPMTPVITSVQAYPTCGTKLVVTANITGATQMETCCKGVCTHECEPNCSFDCTMAEYTSGIDPRISPNPTCIPSPGNNSTNASVCNKSGAQNPKVYYYLEGSEGTKLNAPMTYNASTGKFEAEIDYGSLGGETGDYIVYYIIAADNRGNVVSQVPDSRKAPCTTSNEWDPNFQTPPIDNCSVANSWTKCDYFTAGTPTCSDTSRTINDPWNDTCGKTGTVDGSLDNMDIIGFSAGAGTAAGTGVSGTVVCADVRLDGTPPPEGEGGEYFKAYMMVFYNPDIPDPNPYDTHIVNSFALVYTPGISYEGGPSPVRVLWDGNCFTDPNTSDPMTCRLICGDRTEKKVQVVANDHNLRFIVTNSLPNGKTIIGAQSASVRMVITSVGVDINSTTTPFWITDRSAGLDLNTKDWSILSGNRQVYRPSWQSSTDCSLSLLPPSNIGGYSYPSDTKFGLSLSWTGSVGETYSTIYNIYLCKNDTTAVSDCIGPVAALPTNVSHSLENPKLIADAGISLSDPKKASDNMYNIGITASDGGTTTAIAYSTTKIQINPTNDICNSNPSACATVSISGAFQKYTVRTCAYDAVTCKTGKYKTYYTCDASAEIEVYDSSSGAIVKSTRPIDDGYCTTMLRVHPTTEAQAGKNYNIRVRYASGFYSPAFKFLCSNNPAAGQDCLVDLLTTATAITAGANINIAAKTMPGTASGTGGPEIGNVNGDKKVDISDIGRIKLVFNTKYGDACYRAWADINQDGKVNITDLGLVKLNFGNWLSETPTVPYKSDDDPLPSSCLK